MHAMSSSPDGGLLLSKEGLPAVLVWRAGAGWREAGGIELARSLWLLGTVGSEADKR